MYSPPQKTNKQRNKQKTNDKVWADDWLISSVHVFSTLQLWTDIFVINVYKCLFKKRVRKCKSSSQFQLFLLQMEDSASHIMRVANSLCLMLDEGKKIVYNTWKATERQTWFVNLWINLKVVNKCMWHVNFVKDLCTTSDLDPPFATLYHKCHETKSTFGREGMYTLT